MDEAAVTKTFPLKDRPRKVRALAIAGGRKVQKAKTDDDGAESKQLATITEQWYSYEQQGKVIPPPFDPLFLASLHESSSDLGHMVEAMVTNVVGYGWTLGTTADLPTMNGQLPEDDPRFEEVEIEWEKLQSFLEYGNYEPKSLTYLRRQQRTDYESVGSSFLELVQTVDGDLRGYAHAPAFRMRLTRADDVPTVYEETIVVGRGARRRLETRPKRRRFRRFAQLDDQGSVVYFRELDDPRPISRFTGEVLSGADAKDPRKLANPMLFRRIYAPRTPYGLPRHIGALLALLGSRTSEEVNFTTLANNQVPSLALMVSNGQLTEETVDRIEEFIAENVAGDLNRSRVLIIEAEPDESGTGGGQVKIDMQPLKEQQHEDAMFSKFEAANLEKVRRAYRLPPIISGSSSDYTRSTSDTSRKLAEEQVFEPERREEDWEWNRVLRFMRTKFHEFRTNSPNVTNDEDLIKVIAAAEKTGAMTPRRATALIEDILGRPLAPLDESEINVDVPFSVTMAEAVQNKADPTEPGQQVTALKAADIVGVRDRLMTEFVKREKAIGGGQLPGVIVDTDVADLVLAGVTKSLDLAEERDPGSGLYALCDDMHVMGLVRLGSPVAKSEGVWSYPIEEVETTAPVPHTATGTGFVDRVGSRSTS